MKKYEGPILVLKTTKAGGVPHIDGTTDRNGNVVKTNFRWPRSGHVTCDDWNPAPVCGQGFHGLAFGEGDWDLLRAHETPDEEWRVVRVQPQHVVAFDDGQKVKFSEGEVVYCGNRAEAITHVLCGPEAMQRALCLASSGNGSSSASSGVDSTSASSGVDSTSASSGNGSTSASSGERSTSASSGDFSKSASSGERSTSASSGERSTSASSGVGSKSASSGERSKSASSGNGSTSASSGVGSTSASSGVGSTSASSGVDSTSASSGYGSTSASSGERSTSASSGNGSTSASSGERSKSASSGNGSTSASSGSYGIAAALGEGVRAKAGPNGLIILTWWDAQSDRYRAVVGEVGISGIKADTWYHVKNGALVEDDPQ